MTMSDERCLDFYLFFNGSQALPCPSEGQLYSINNDTV